MPDQDFCGFEEVCVRWDGKGGQTGNACDLGVRACSGFQNTLLRNDSEKEPVRIHYREMPHAQLHEKAQRVFSRIARPERQRRNQHHIPNGRSHSVKDPLRTRHVLVIYE